MNREYKIALSQEYYSDIVYLSQYDSNYDLVFSVLDKYAKATQINGYTAKFQGTRTDGLGFLFEGTASDDHVAFHINTSLTAISGTHKGEIVFYDANGLFYGSANVQIVVEPAARPDGTIDADVEKVQTLAEQVQEIVGTAAEQTTAEAERIVANLEADVSELKSGLSDLKEDLGYNVTFTPEIERASINATTGKNTSDAYTAYYRTGGFYRPKHIKATSSRGYLNTWIFFYASDDVNTFISRSVAYSNLDADVEYPDGANYVRISGQVSKDPDNPIDLTAITVVMTPILEDVNTRLDNLEADQTDIGALSQKVTANTDNIKNVRTLDVLRNYPICDHLFINKTGSDIVIPSESIYHARISRRLGYRVMELNTRITSDGVLFVHHLANGKFGQYFHHADGETDISNIMANTVTWQWILDNVRYNSQIERFRTAPSTLETMLRECKQQNIIPLVERVGNALQVADEIMGKDNYIAHGATREQAPTATIIRWNQTLTTKQDIVDYCDAIGTPLIYAIGNPTSFTDEQLADITATLHDKGYMMGTSYNDYWWYKYRRFGFDFDSAQMLMNRIECGNICNYQSIFGFDNFTYTNANAANGELTYTAGGTLSPNIDSTVYQLSGFDLEIVYNGRVTFPKVGEFNGVTINSDGATPIYLSVPIINGSPKITLTVAKGTVIKDIKFSASVF